MVLFINSGNTPGKVRSGKSREAALSRYGKYMPRTKYERSDEAHQQPQGFFRGSTFPGDMSQQFFRKIIVKKVKKHKK